MGFDLVNTIPIMIGTLPLRNIWQSMPAYPPPTVPEGKNFASNKHSGSTEKLILDKISFILRFIACKLGWVAPVIPIEGYSDLPPPTYSTAIGIDEGESAS